MMQNPAAADGNPLAEAQDTIARQAAELDRLRRQQAAADLASELKAALAQAMSTGTIAAPVPQSALLDMIVETAADVIGAQSASLLLIDETTQELIFEVALGAKAADVRKLRVPLGHGIAGLVAVSGQAMAISDAASDPRQAADIAKRIGYAPQSILCVPLVYRDRVIGVLELIDKTSAPSFSPGDMATLSLFANQAAVAIAQSRTHDSAVSLLAELIASLGTDGVAPRAALQGKIDAFAAGLDSEDVDYREALALATLVREIAWHGEREAELCRQILEAFAGYLRGGRHTLASLGGRL